MSEQEPRVTKRHTLAFGNGTPDPECTTIVSEDEDDRPCVLMWLTDYDAMREELERLRRQATAAEADHKLLLKQFKEENRD